MMRIFLTFCSVIFISCNSSSTKTVYKEIEKEQNQARETLKKESNNTKTYLLPNDEFKEKVLVQISNEKDLESFNNILKKLDKKKLSVCTVISELLRLDDECLAKARSIYPDALEQDQFSKLYSDCIKNKYKTYRTATGLSQDEVRFLNTANVFLQPVQSFCKSK